MTISKDWESKCHSKRNMKERLTFIRIYVKKLKENPDDIFQQQVKLVNSFLKAAKNFSLTTEEYLRMKGELKTKDSS